MDDGGIMIRLTFGQTTLEYLLKLLLKFPHHQSLTASLHSSALSSSFPSCQTLIFAAVRLCATTYLIFHITTSKGASNVVDVDNRHTRLLSNTVILMFLVNVDALLVGLVGEISTNKLVQFNGSPLLLCAHPSSPSIIGDLIFLCKKANCFKGNELLIKNDDDDVPPTRYVKPRSRRLFKLELEAFKNKHKLLNLN
ncbi:hypothetical protein JHK87_006459 [Glycine soja]|nr:hypothetical protein JHK87_006459 [Glycine soja]